MTFTARMAAWVAKNRILAYALATLALTAYLVLTFSPAHAGAITLDSPNSIRNAAASNCSYLTFCRWDNLSQTGQPPIIGMPELFIVNVMFLLGHFLFFIIGQTYIFVDGLNIYYNLLYFSDGVFAKISVISSSGGVSGVPLTITVAVAAIIILAFTIVVPSMSKKFSGGGSPIKTGAFMLLGIVILSVMATASARNHSGTPSPSPIAGIATGGDGDSIHKNDVGNAAKDPNQWAPLSLGWAVAWGDTGAKLIGDVAVNVIGTMTNAITLTSSSGTPSACDVYIDSMHNLYAGGDSSKLNGGVLGIEKLYKAAVLDQYATSNFGDSTGAQNAWCRVLELDKPVAEQVLISDNAKNVDDKHALYKPALDVMIDSNGNWINGDTSSQTQNHRNTSSISGFDTFKGSNFGAGLATSYFAPPPSDSLARYAHRAYFAACKPLNGTLVLNSDWAGVQRADTNWLNNAWSIGNETLGEMSSSPVKDANGINWDLTTKNICNSMATGSTDSVNSTDGALAGNTVAIGFWQQASDATGDPGSNGGKTDYIKRIGFKGGSANDILTLLFSGQGIDQSSHFVTAQGGLSGPAYNYYATSTGISWGGGFLDGAIMLFVAYLIARMAFPIVLGGAIAQFISATIMMVLPLFMMGAVVWPTRKMKSLNIKSFSVVISGSLVSTVFTAIFLVYAGLFSFVNSVLILRQSANPIGTNFISAANGIALLLAGLISYSLMKILLSKTLNFDPTSFKSAMSTASNAVMSPLTSSGNGSVGAQLKGAMQAPFQSVRSLVKTPFDDVQSNNSWSKLRKAGDSVMGKADQLRDRTGRTASAASPQGATTTSSGTDVNPLIGVIIDPNGAQPNGGVNVTATAVNSGSVLTDEQHRQRLIDQVKNSYGSAQADKVFPNGIPADYADMISKAPLDEIKKLSEILGSRVEGSDGPRATPDQAAENMKKFAAMGGETLRQNPNGFDESISYAERAATQAEMFRGVHPLSNKDISSLSGSDRKNYESRKFDLVGGSLPDGRSVSFDSGADVIKGEVVPDPLTSRNVPNAIVRSGSQNIAPMEGVTQDGTSLFGAKRDTNPDGTPKEDWGLTTLDSGARQLPPTMFESSIPPAGVTPEQWNDVNDLHGWIKEHNIQADSTAMSSWPKPRREQASRVAEVMDSVMSAQGVPMVSPENLETLAPEGVGVTSDADAFTFGESTPNADFKPSGMRDAIASGKRQLAALENSSMERAELLMGHKIETQLEDAKAKLAENERLLAEKLDERSSLVTTRAEAQLAGLIEALSLSNSQEAHQIAELMSAGRWDEITDVLNESGDEEEDGYSLKDEIREIVEASKDRLRSLNESHKSNVALLYERLAEEREAISEAVHRDVEIELQNDIDRNVDGVRDLAFAGASETSKRHVEGMLSWFPAIKNKFFGGNHYADHEEVEDMEDADADGIDDRVQVGL